MSPTRDLNAVALFVQVADSGSFTRAAARAGMPVSTVSRKVAELEHSLGVRLLERSTRRLRLTEVGEDYLEHCRRGVGAFEAADALVSDRRTELAGRLRVSVPPSMSDLVVLPLAAAFQARHPKVSVHCLVTERHVEHIADGVDLSLRVGEPPDSSLVARVVTLHRPRLVAAPAYLAHAAPPPVGPQALGPHVQVAFSRWERPLEWELHDPEGRRVQVRPAPGLVINDYAAVLRGVLEGRGISELPSFIAAPPLADGRLVEVLPDWRFASLRVAVTYPSNRQLSPLVRAFRDFCAEYFAAHPLAPAD